jgi:hypothetical protein
MATENETTTATGATATAVPKKLTSFKAAVAKVGGIDIQFDIISVEPTQTEGVELATLELYDPIEKILGSQKVMDNGVPTELIKYDTQFLKLSSNDWDVEGFEFEQDEEGNITSGRYKGNKLRFDIAKSSGDAWLVSKPFSMLGQEMRNKNQTERSKRVAAALRGRSHKMAGE